MTAYIIVTSDTSKVSKSEFNNWYEEEHLVEALNAFNAMGAKRGWINNSKIHLAIYKFKNIMLAKKALKSKILENLIKNFDDRWNKKVFRTRELIETIQEILI
ncbi:MAG: hypothetical protein O2916_11890 [Proteobacteria bacterium]|nr:hypothetical protein [Pseudomonadota bacterium]